ncbi:hypothetical protein QIH80_11975 [Bradyrhizobium elkanii]|nr:hypothetical protein QIH80_11975 [Bradyrhizobium elkanii]
MFSVSDVPCSPWQAKHAAARSWMVSAFAEKAMHASAKAVVMVLYIGHSGMSRHCEERSDEAIHCSASGGMDCFASLAMTVTRLSTY